jgi:hypothetical protein
MRRVSLVLATMVGACLLPSPSAAGPRPCDAAQARAVVRGFVDAYGRGDADYLDQLWAQEPDFFWYTVDDDVLRRGALSEDRTTLPLYFHERSLYGEQLRLRTMEVQWEKGWHAAWHVRFVVHRTSDLPGATGRYEGTGALTCNRMIAWAMARASDGR